MKKMIELLKAEKISRITSVLIVGLMALGSQSAQAGPPTDCESTRLGYCGQRLENHIADWQHIQLKSRSNVTISIDFQPYYWGVLDRWYEVNGRETVWDRLRIKETKHYRTAKNLWINVSAPGLHPGQSVRAVFMTYRDGDHNCSVVLQGPCFSKELQLQYQGEGRYSVAFGDDLVIGGTFLIEQFSPSSYSRDWTVWHEGEIAVVIDGDWQDDPVGGGHNFKFNLP